MASPPVSSADHRRTVLLDRLADHVLDQGLAGASLRPLARAAGTSDRMLLYYFADKAALIAAIIGRIAERLTLALSAEGVPQQLPFAALRTRLFDQLTSASLRPYMRVWLDIAAASARGDPMFQPIATQIAQGFLAWGAAQLDCPNEQDRARQSVQLLVEIEGMMFLDAVGLGEVVRGAC